MRKELHNLLCLGGFSLVGLFTMTCGLGLAFGSRFVSLVGFFSTLLMLALLWVLIKFFIPRDLDKPGKEGRS